MTNYTDRYESYRSDDIQQYQNLTTHPAPSVNQASSNPNGNLTDQFEDSTIQLSEGLIFVAKPKAPSQPVRIKFPPRVKKYENNRNQLPESFQKSFDSHFDFQYQPEYLCNSTEPVIIFKSSRLNFERRKEVREHLKDIGLASNYFFLTGQKSSGERQAGTDKYEGRFDIVPI